MFEFLFSSFLVYMSLLYHLFVPKAKRSLRGEIALITGSAFGIGRQLCIKLARMGVVVVCVDIDREKNEETKRTIESEGGVAYAYVHTTVRS